MVLLTFVMSCFGMAAGCRGIECAMPSKTWLVITMNRSGSRWLVDTMAERTGKLVSKVREMHCDGCHCGAQRTDASASECACALHRKYENCNTTHAIGFKLMLKTSDGEPHDSLAAGVCFHSIPVVFYWRRNVLRRIVSNIANKVSPQKTHVAHEAHPRSESVASAIRAYKPSIDAKSLVHAIDSELRVRRSVEDSFWRLNETCEVARNAKVFYYEDMRDGVDGASAVWGDFFGTLKLWRPDSTLTIIHGNEKLLDTVANPDAVTDALNQTEHAWMLWD